MNNNNFLSETTLTESMKIIRSNGRKVILLVEDDPIMAMSESINLENYGYNVIRVLNDHKASDFMNHIRI